MDFDAYENTLPYPARPVKPVLGRGFDDLSMEDQATFFAMYTQKRTDYEAALVKYRAAIEAYHNQQLQLTEQFRQDLFRELGIETNPKRNMLFLIAWDLGHASGLREVFQYADDLSDLIR